MTDKKFLYHAPVRLHLTDAAGVLFFGSYFTLAHDAYETYMESIGFHFDRIFKQSDYLLLIAHAEGDYKAPMFTGDPLSIEVTCTKLGSRSYTLQYVIKREDNEMAVMRTVHVCVDKETGKSRALPSELRDQLKGISG